MAKPKIQNHRSTYFIGVFRGRKLYAVKVGLATKGKVDTRIRNLQTASPDRLKLLVEVEGNFEKKFHRQFRKDRMGNSEFFRPTKRLVKMIRDLREIRELLEKYESTTSRGSNPN